MYDTANIAQGRPISEVRIDPDQFYCNVQNDVVYGSFARITTGSFQDPRIAWCNVSNSGTNWVYFDIPALAGSVAVCRIIPYDRPVLLATGGSPQNGHRYNLPGLSEDENGEFTCVGSNNDGILFWYVRNAGVGGVPVQSDDYVSLKTVVHNGFHGSINSTSANSTIQGFNGLRSGLGVLQSQQSFSPLPVLYNNNGVLAQKQSDGQPLYYKNLTYANEPVYDSNGTIQYEELTTFGQFNGHAALYLFLKSLAIGESTINGVTYDYSDTWETTTDVTEAVPNNFVMVRPHLYTGWYCTKGSYKVLTKETIDISVGDRTKTADCYSLEYDLNSVVKFKGQWNGTIKYGTVTDGNINWTTLGSISDYVNNYNKTMIVVPTNDIDLMDVNKIENTCGTGSVNVPVPIGMFIDGNGLPQFVNCDSIPFQHMIPLLSVVCLYRMNNGNCSPAYQTNSYMVALSAPWLKVMVANYLVGTACS
jgi:hypothetical protein